MSASPVTSGYTAPNVRDVPAMVALLRARGIAVCKPDPAEKSPQYARWPTRSLEAANFNVADQVGAMGGPLSNCNRPGHSLIPVDLDAALAVQLADDYLPPTAMVEGRPGKPRGHRYYLVPNDTIPEWARSSAAQASKAAREQKGHPGPAIRHFRHRATGEGVLDFIGTGGQVVCPPSVWTSEDGTRTERREWEGGVPGEPAVVPFLVLWRAVCDLAAACGAKIPDEVPRPSAPRPRIQIPADDLERRARAFLTKIPGARSGFGGHKATMWAMRCMVYGFDLGRELGLRVIQEDYNPRCEPPWSDKELEHKADHADRTHFDKPRGWLRDKPPTDRAAPPGVNFPSSGGAAQSQTPHAAEAKAAAPPPNDPFDAGISLADLMAADLPAPRFVFDDLLTEGLSILAGRPKSGKSWLALLMAIAAHRGLKCLGAALDAKRPVLHLALEDTRRRYRDRAKKLLKAIGVDAGDNLTIRTNWPRAGKGGLLRIAEWLKENPGGLVIVDTLAKFRDPPSGRGSSYDEDYRAISELKTLADQYGGAVLVIHHTRKGAAEDPFDEVSGTLGINGAADSMMILDRQRGTDSAALYLTGRDLPEATLSLAWNGDRGLWTCVSRADGIERPERATAPNKVDRCAAWLSDLLTRFAFPDDDLVAIALHKKFTEHDLKDAKAKLRKANPPLRSKARGFQGTWWNWIGNPAPPDRPPNARAELLDEDLAETSDTGGAAA